MWSANTGNSTLGYDILISQSLDNGLSFSNPIDGSSVVGSSVFPEMIVDGSSLYFTWTQYNYGSYSILWAKVSNARLVVEPQPDRNLM